VNVVIKEDIRQECFTLLKKLSQKGREIRLTSQIFKGCNSEMCKQMLDVVDSALSVVRMLELTK